MGSDRAIGLVLNRYFAGVVVRVPALVSLTLAVGVTIYSKGNLKELWKIHNLLYF